MGPDGFCNASFARNLYFNASKGAVGGRVMVLLFELSPHHPTYNPIPVHRHFRDQILEHVIHGLLDDLTVHREGRACLGGDVKYEGRAVVGVLRTTSGLELPRELRELECVVSWLLSYTSAHVNTMRARLLLTSQ